MCRHVQFLSQYTVESASVRLFSSFGERLTTAKLNTLWCLTESATASCGYERQLGVDHILTDGRQVLALPFYHVDVNPTERIWADCKQQVATKHTAIFRNRTSRMGMCVSPCRTCKLLLTAWCVWGRSRTDSNATRRWRQQQYSAVTKVTVGSRCQEYNNYDGLWLQSSQVRSVKLELTTSLKKKLKENTSSFNINVCAALCVSYYTTARLSLPLRYWQGRSQCSP